MEYNNGLLELPLIKKKTYILEENEMSPKTLLKEFLRNLKNYLEAFEIKKLLEEISYNISITATEEAYMLSGLQIFMLCVQVN